jgi:carboxylate-amine ligase
MTTYGPDINVSLPPDLAATMDLEDLTAKINYYGPALAALSVASPFCDGKPWTIRERRGKSFRMYKRSYIAPPLEFHPDEGNRLEFKDFDMPNSLIEFEAQILSFVSLILDENLNGRASRQSRIYDLGQVARFGLAAECMKTRAMDLLHGAEKVLGGWGFDTRALDVFNERVSCGKTPADEMLEVYDRSGSVEEILRQRSRFDFNDPYDENFRP